MFLLVSGRHVGAHLGGHQHGVPIQISINLGNTFLRISSIRVVAWILARVFAYLPSFFSQILDLIYWTVLIFLFWSSLNGVTLKICTITKNRFCHLGPVHTYPDIFESATFSFRIRLWSTRIRRIRKQIRKFLNPLSRVEIFESDNISDTCGRSNPDILWYDVGVTKSAPVFIYLANLNMAADRR